MVNKEIIEKIELALETVRPYLQEDGGDIEIVELTEDKVVKVRLLGNCESCPMSFTTMKAGVEEAVKRLIPEIKGIEAVNI